MPKNARRATPTQPPTPAKVPPAIVTLPPEIRARCVTVRQLVEKLTGYKLQKALNGANLDAVVVLQHDPEGNGYGPLALEGIEPDLSCITFDEHHFDLLQDDTRERFNLGEESTVVLVPLG